MLIRKDIWSKIENFFTPPTEYEDDPGSYRSVLDFYDGNPVRTADDWAKRRQEILELWHGAMGKWPCLIEQPKIEYLEEEHTENFTRHKVSIEIAPGRMQTAYLLIPEGKGPFPAVLDMFYGPEGGGRSNYRIHPAQFADTTLFHSSGRIDNLDITN